MDPPRWCSIGDSRRVKLLIKLAPCRLREWGVCSRSMTAN